MSDERWIVQVESVWVYDVWYDLRPQYVSEEVARLALKYVWEGKYTKTHCRVRRVS